MKLIDFIAKHGGFDSTGHFIDSTFHPDSVPNIIAVSSVFASIGYIVEFLLGVQIPVTVVIILLFILELYTGIKASKKEGNKFESPKFRKGFIKLFIYMIMIGCAHWLANTVPVKPFFGFTFNVYEWLHYGFVNFVILELFISNIENFDRLGWKTFVPFLKKIKGILNINLKKDGEGESEEGNNEG
jgi:phage-related holin